jgi:hypothetical protein
MKSNKQRRIELKAKRLERKMRQARVAKLPTTLAAPSNAIKVNNSLFAQYWSGPWIANNGFYEDYGFICRDCARPQVWTPAQQQWWYEIAGGNRDSVAVRCRLCRVAERERVAAARAASRAPTRKGSPPPKA